MEEIVAFQKHDIVYVHSGECLISLRDLPLRSRSDDIYVVLVEAEFDAAPGQVFGELRNEPVLGVIDREYGRLVGGAVAIEYLTIPLAEQHALQGLIRQPFLQPGIGDGE